MKPVKIESEGLWVALRKAESGTAVIYSTILPEDVPTQERSEREAIACRLEDHFVKAPSLELYCRIGMYDFLGLGSLTVEEALAWFHQSNVGRFGVATAGEDGALSAEKLIVGTAEASRQHRDCFAFHLVDGWVRPA